MCCLVSTRASLSVLSWAWSRPSPHLAPLWDSSGFSLFVSFYGLRSGKTRGASFTGSLA